MMKFFVKCVIVLAAFSVSAEEMGAFLEQFPELSECTIEQQEEALAFYNETQKIEELLSEATQAMEACDSDSAQLKVDEAAEILGQLADQPVR